MHSSHINTESLLNNLCLFGQNGQRRDFEDRLGWVERFSYIHPLTHQPQGDSALLEAQHSEFSYFLIFNPLTLPHPPSPTNLKEILLHYWRHSTVSSHISLYLPPPPNLKEILHYWRHSTVSSHISWYLTPPPPHHQPQGDSELLETQHSEFLLCPLQGQNARKSAIFQHRDRIRKNCICLRVKSAKL